MYGACTGSSNLSAFGSGTIEDHKSSYRVKYGENLQDIASKLHMSERKLLELNPQLNSSQLITPGQILTITDTTSSYLSDDHIDNKLGEIHIVQSGETLEGIARRYKTTEKFIRKDNPQDFKPGERGRFYPGQRLLIRLVNTGDEESLEDNNSNYNEIETTQNNQSEYCTHTIRRKDTFESLCEKYKISYNQLLKINSGRFSTGNRIELVVGESIIVPNPKAQPVLRNVAEVKLTKKIHIVQEGETPESIAQFYNMTMDEMREFNRAYFPKGHRGHIQPNYKLVVKR